MKKESQNKKVLKFLKKGKTLTALEAFNWFGCLALHSRINDLRTLGHPIKTDMIILNEKRVGKYSYIHDLSEQFEHAKTKKLTETQKDKFDRDTKEYLRKWKNELHPQVLIFLTSY